ncbi:hypothetical protein BC829DRAFT_403609, partial [Chytridium lagenaria]
NSATGIQNMAFKIRDSELLPTSHTCFNQLCLPRYKSKEKLEANINGNFLEVCLLHQF